MNSDLVKVIEIERDGAVVGYVRYSEEVEYIYINQISVEKTWRRQGIASELVYLVIKKTCKPLYGELYSAHGARFWGQFSRDIPLELDDTELEEWCYNYGWFSVELGCPMV